MNDDSPRITRPILVLFLCAFGLRALHVVFLVGEPLFEAPPGDGRVYLAWADAIRSGETAREVWYQAPLYAHVLAAVRSLVGESRLALGLVQGLFGASACVLLALAGARWTGARTGLVAGSLLAVYPAAVFHDGLVQKASLTLLLVCAVLFAAARLDRGPGSRVVFGALLGLWMLNRGEARLVALALGGWAVAAGAGRRRVTAAAVLAGAALVLAPALVRNRVVGGEWVLTTAQAGPNFYIGNHAGASGLYEPLVPGGGDARRERADARGLAEAAAGRQLSASEVSRHFLERGLADVRAAPLAWSRLLARKVGLALNHTEAADTEDQRATAAASPVLRVLDRAFGFGPLLVLAAIGAVLAGGARARLAPAAWLVAAQLAAVVLFFVSARYRLPLVPPLCLFAAVGLVEGLARRRTGARGGFWWALLAGGGAAVVAFWPLLERDGQFATHWSNVAAAHLDAGELAAAEEAALRATARDPRHFDAWIQLGIARVRLERPREAADCFAAALDIAPGHARTLKQLGRAHLFAGEPGRAADVLAPLALRTPADTQALELAATALVRLQDPERLAALLRARLAAVPDDAAAREQLRALEAAGR